MSGEPPICSFANCQQVGAHLCSGCLCVRYCSGACQKGDWAAGHKRKCKAVQSAKSIFIKELPMEKRLSFLNSKECDDEESFSFVIKAIPDFYKRFLPLIDEDSLFFEDPMNNRCQVIWSNYFLCTCLRNVNSGSGPGKFKGVHVRRFMDFLSSDPAMWLSLLKCIKSMVSIISGAGPAARKPVTDTIRALGDACAARPIASFVLENYFDATTSTLKQLWIKVKDDPNVRVYC
jgi:hypothetical protein